MSTLEEKRAVKDRSSQVVIFVILSSLLLFTHLHTGGLSGYDDALYAHEAKQMLVTGEWWTARDNGILNFEYPPLFLWMEAVSMRFFGVSDFAAKFPVALCGLLTIILTFCIARRWSNDVRTAIVAAWVLMLSQYFLKYSMHAMTDVPFTFLFTAAIFFYINSDRHPWQLLLSGVFIGAAILTRSILGLLPAAVIIGYRMWVEAPLLGKGGAGVVRSTSEQILAVADRTPNPSFAKQGNLRWLIAAFAVAAILPAIWYVTEYLKYGDVFRREHLAFINGKLSSGAPRGAWEVLRGLTEYPWLLIRLYWPWLPLMLAGLVTAVRKASVGDKLSRLLVVWVIAVIVPLSFAEAKVLRYILPVFPAFAMLAAIPLGGWIGRLQDRRRFAIAYWVFVAIVVLIAVFQTPQARAEEMSTLAPIVDRNTPLGERVLIYTHGEPRYDYVNQLLWYSNRFSEHLADAAMLREQLLSGMARTYVIDKTSYAEIVRALGAKVAILGESESFVCFRTV